MRSTRRRGPLRAARLSRDLDACDRDRRGVQPAAIYHWYPSKEAILVDLQDEFMERLTEKLDAAMDRLEPRR